MRVVVVTAALPDKEGARALILRGHRVTVITPTRKPGRPGIVEELGLRIRSGCVIRDRRELHRAIRECDPEMVLAVGYHVAALARVAGWDCVTVPTGGADDLLRAVEVPTVEPPAPPAAPMVPDAPLPVSALPADRSVPIWTWVIFDMGVGGAQQAIWRYLMALPPWLRERAQLFPRNWPLNEGGWNLPLALRLEVPDAPKMVHAYDRRSTHVTSLFGRLELEDERAVVADLGTRYTALLGSQYVHGHKRIYPSPDVRFSRCYPASQAILDKMEMAKWIRNISDEPPVVVSPPMTRPSRIVERRPWRGDRPIRCAYVGRISPDKGGGCIPWILAADPQIEIAMFAGVESSYPVRTQETQAHNVGRILDACISLGVQYRLHCRGFDVTTDYARMYAGQDCAVVLSPSEGFGFSVAEALACGVPVAATRGANAVGMVTDQTGALFDFDDSDGKSKGSPGDWRKMAAEAAAAIRLAATRESAPCMAAVERYMIDGGWPRAFGDALLDGERLHPSPGAIGGRPARVTVMLRYHEGAARLAWLDAAMWSVTRQTYRDFETVLCFDGHREAAAALAARYGGIGFVCTDEAPSREHIPRTFRLAVERSRAEFVKPLDYDDRLLPDYLARAVAACDADGWDLWSCRMLVEVEGDGRGPQPHSWPAMPLEAIATGPAIPHLCTIMRREPLLRAGNYGTQRLQPGDDDQVTFRRMWHAGCKLFRDDSYSGAIYRCHPDQVTVWSRKQSAAGMAAK